MKIVIGIVFLVLLVVIAIVGLVLIVRKDERRWRTGLTLIGLVLAYALKAFNEAVEKEGLPPSFSGTIRHLSPLTPSPGGQAKPP
jgi:hypothetical protein